MAGFYGKSKPNNAVMAELQGKYPAYKAEKILRIPIKAIIEILSSCGWHNM